MELTLQLDDDANPQIVNQILNLARQADADLYEAAKRGWVFYGLAAAEAKDVKEDTTPTWAVHKLLVQTEKAPFSDAHSSTERQEVQNTLERLELDGLVDREWGDGEWEGWKIPSHTVTHPETGINQSSKSQGVEGSSQD